MKLKQRLYLSNVIMIILPIVFVLASGYLIFFTVNRHFGQEFYQHWRENATYFKLTESIEEIGKQKKTTDLTQQLQEMYEKKGSKQVEVFYFDDQNQLVWKSEQEVDSIVEQVLAQPMLKQVSFDQRLIEKIPFQKGTVIVVNNAYHAMIEKQLFEHKELLQKLIWISLLVALLLTVIAMMVFARILYQPIKKGLSVLIKGVDTISQGELDYRIDYQTKDEFQEAIDNFNQMASRLEIMVEQQQQLLENRKALIAGMSHDIKTPLTSIKAYVEGLEQGIAQTPEQYARYLQIITQKTNELNRLVDQLFLFSKLDIGEETIHYDQVIVDDALRAYIVEHELEFQTKELIVKLDLAAPTTKVWIDPQHLRNIWLNLFENSLKYARVSPVVIHCQTKVEYDQLLIRIEDNGQGVEPTQLPYLFDIFYRGDQARTNPGKGSGIGLAMVKKIVESANGTVSAYLTGVGGLGIQILFPQDKEEGFDGTNFNY